MTAQIPPHHDPACWGCGDAPDGIHLPTPTTEGADRYEARFRFDERHQAGPGLVHGGLVGAALDEACGLLATWYRFPAVTARIFIRYRRPVPINRELTVRSAVERTSGRRIRVRADLRDGDEILAEARAAFLHVPLEHFLATPEGRAAGERWRRRLANGRAGENVNPRDTGNTRGHAVDRAPAGQPPTLSPAFERRNPSQGP